MEFVRVAYHRYYFLHGKGQHLHHCQSRSQLWRPGLIAGRSEGGFHIVQMSRLKVEGLERRRTQALHEELRRLQLSVAAARISSAAASSSGRLLRSKSLRYPQSLASSTSSISFMISQRLANLLASTIVTMDGQLWMWGVAERVSIPLAASDAMSC